MSGAVRVLLIWVLTIVIPFKAIAMGSAIGCGPGHHGSPSLEPAQFPVSDLADRGWAEQSGHASDGGHVGERMRGASGSTDVHDDERSPSAHAKVKCGTCAPCCAAVGPATDRLPPQISQAPVQGAAFAPQFYAGVQADVPHRLPKA